MAVVNKVLLSKSKELFDIEDADAQSQLLEIYTKDEVDELLSKLNTLKIKKVDRLPTTNIDPKTLYLVPITPAETNNGYDEYLYLDNKWEKIGTTSVDLSQYYTKSQVDAELAKKQDNLTIDTALSSTSTNPVQNKAIKSAIDLKADTTTVNAALNDKADKSEIPTKTSDITNDSNYVSDANYSHITVDSALSNTSKNPVQNKVVKTALDGKSNTGHGHTKSDISDFPTLANVATSGNYSDLSGTPTKVSEFTNDSGFITKAVNDLANYYTKTNTYTKTEVDTLIGNISTLKIVIVQTLPTTDISTTTIYLVPATTTGTNDSYDEYIYVSNKWEKIGNTRVDLSNYYTKDEVDAELDKKQNTITFPLAIGSGGTGKTSAKAAQNALLSGMNEVTSNADGNTYITCTYATTSDSNGAIYKRKLSYFWNWIKGKFYTHSTTARDADNLTLGTYSGRFTNTPKEYGTLIHNEYNGAAKNYGSQIFIPIGDYLDGSGNNLYHRSCSNGTWNTWQIASNNTISKVEYASTTSATTPTTGWSTTFPAITKGNYLWTKITYADNTEVLSSVYSGKDGSVTGVKGNSESSYRTGNVNITAANIGLGNVNNTSDANKPISTKTQSALDTKLNIDGSNATSLGISSGLSVLNNDSATDDFKDETQIIASHVDGYSSTNNTFFRRNASYLWNYIKDKISSVLGLTETSYDGTSAKATKDGNGNTITSSYCRKFATTMVGLGFTAGSKVDVAEFLNKIRASYGDRCIIQFSWSEAYGAIITDGTNETDTISGYTLFVGINSLNTTSGTWKNSGALLVGSSTHKNIYLLTATISATEGTVSSKYVTTIAKTSDLTGKENTSNKVTSFQETPDDSHYPSEKLVKSSLDNKVDKVTGKGLSTNDLTSTLKSHYDTAYTNNHTHTNKSLLDSYTQSESNLSDAVSKKHSHSNKTLLDSYDQTNANISDAITKKHSHSNKEILDNTTVAFTGHQDISGKEDSANKKTEWSATPSDTNYPSEKLVNDSLDKKVDKIDGKGLSTNDYTTTEKEKLGGIAAGANKTTVTDNLTSTSTTNALSANQGKKLKDLVDGKNDTISITDETSSGTFADGTEFVLNPNSNSNPTSFKKRKGLNLWNYIRDKLNSHTDVNAAIKYTTIKLDNKNNQAAIINCRTNDGGSVAYILTVALIDLKSSNEGYNARAVKCTQLTTGGTKITSITYSKTGYIYIKHASNQHFTIHQLGASNWEISTDTTEVSGDLTCTINKRLDSIDLGDMDDWASVSDVTYSSVVYHTFWKIAPTASNDVYGIAIHPTNGRLYRVRSNKGAYSVTNYDANTTYVFNSTYNSSTNKAATMLDITNNVADNLTTDSSTKALSAKQGKALDDGKADKATTLSGYGITDAKIDNGVITLGSNTITPITDVSGKMDKKNPTGTGSFSLNRKADTDIGDCSFTEGYETTASGDYSHAEGYETTASGDYSHAEGDITTASGDCSHAEGKWTTSLGTSSHSEGIMSIASGLGSHAEGRSSALGDFSHAEGEYTTASKGSHVQGKYNVLDIRYKYADIIGNGISSDERKNIEATDWDGNKYLKGDVYTGCNDDSTGGSKLESTSNKVTEWNETVSNTNYPSEKLVKDSLDNKVDKVLGKGLSTNDYDNTEKGSITYYGTCSTSRSENKKVVTCDGFVLKSGCRIVVKFTDTAGSAPTSGNISMDINGTGEKYVYTKNNSQATYSTSGEFRNNRYCLFLYDGSRFVWLNYDSNTTYSQITQAEIDAGSSKSSRLVTPELLNVNFQKKNNLVTAFQETPDDTHYPSEKLVKDLLDRKASKGSNDTVSDEITLTAKYYSDSTTTKTESTLTKYVKYIKSYEGDCIHETYIIEIISGYNWASAKEGYIMIDGLDSMFQSSDYYFVNASMKISGGTSGGGFEYNFDVLTTSKIRMNIYNRNSSTLWTKPTFYIKVEKWT